MKFAIHLNADDRHTVNNMRTCLNFQIWSQKKAELFRKHFAPANCISMRTYLVRCLRPLSMSKTTKRTATHNHLFVSVVASTCGLHTHESTGTCTDVVYIYVWGHFWMRYIELKTWNAHITFGIYAAAKHNKHKMCTKPRKIIQTTSTKIPFSKIRSAIMNRPTLGLCKTGFHHIEPPGPGYSQNGNAQNGNSQNT